ncbi:MAG: glycosyltransferase family 39 protein [Candidatus Binatia bacterium]
MTINRGSFTNKLAGPWARPATTHWLPLLLWVGIVAALFYQLGAAALFEPDEGRNAEKAREILVLNDWVTPHENFHPVLDKPIFFYWMIAMAFQFFGVSEWAARLPSVLAALGCLALVYRFAHARWGRWTALWSILILLTCVEFFVLARVVIFDMLLTFFLTLALCASYEAMHAENDKRRRIWSLAMCLGLGAATLLKGLVGVVVPGMVIIGYLLASKQWKALRSVDVVAGALLFLAIVLPWYLMAEWRNPGYLQYYLWEEHFGRFVTNEFDRAEPWYYFIGIGVIGFLPWSLLLPLFARHAYKNGWQRKFDDKSLYLIGWAVLPFLFFSISKSKLPHYILPIFPALAMLTAAAMVRVYQEAPGKMRFALSLTWWVQIICSTYFLLGWLFPEILPHQIRFAVGAMPYFIWIYAALTAAIFVYMTKRNPAGQPRSQRRLYVVQSLSLCFFLVLVVKMMILISPERSAKAIAEATLPKLASATQVVQYDTYLAGLAFYLQSQRPVWLITRDGKERTLLGNYYAIGKQEDPTTLWGQAIFNLQEFHEHWKTTNQPLLIILKDKNLRRFAANLGASPSKLASVDEYILVSKP